MKPKLADCVAESMTCPTADTAADEMRPDSLERAPAWRTETTPSTHAPHVCLNVFALENSKYGQYKGAWELLK